jgi:hypothetical protein
MLARPATPVKGPASSASRPVGRPAPPTLGVRPGEKGASADSCVLWELGCSGRRHSRLIECGAPQEDHEGCEAWQTRKGGADDHDVQGNAGGPGRKAKAPLICTPGPLASTLCRTGCSPGSCDSLAPLYVSALRLSVARRQVGDGGHGFGEEVQCLVRRHGCLAAGARRTGKTPCQRRHYAGILGLGKCLGGRRGGRSPSCAGQGCGREGAGGERAHRWPGMSVLLPRDLAMEIACVTSLARKSSVARPGRPRERYEENKQGRLAARASQDRRERRGL